MQISGQYFTQPVLNRINQTVQSEPTISRRELSLRVCQWLDWKSPNGNFQEMSCRKALTELAHRNVVTLPLADKRKYSFSRPSQSSLDMPFPDIQCTLAELGKITVEPVTSRYARMSKVWFSLLEKHHYLGAGKLCGAQIRYVVHSQEHGYLGALSFSSGSWALRKRDEYIGWTENARRANLQRLVKNDRFLILPSVEVRHLASHVLSLSLARLVNDWEQRYQVRPVLVETFVDPSRFQGTCYKAANWKHVGDTAGRRDGRAKKIFVYPLTRKWRSILGKEPQFRLGAVPRPSTPSDWTEEEFGTIRFHDQRLKERLYKVANDFYNSPMATIPESCYDRKKILGAYRFFRNERVTMDVILTPHVEATIERIKEHRIVLAPQDTTTLSYNKRTTEGFGPINTAKDTTAGLLLHDTLAFTEKGTPLGVLDAQCWARDPKKMGKKYSRAYRPIEEKESIKWLRSFQKVAEIQKLCPDTMLVSVGDREADIFELFQLATKDPSGPKLLVRLDRHRWRKIAQENPKDSAERNEAKQFELLWDVVSNKSIAGTLDIHIPHSGNRKARDTTIEIRFSKITVQPPQRLASASPVEAWAVSVHEEKSKAVGKPLEWMLLTTVPTTNFKEATKRVEWYSGRWGIEVYHRTLKSGCRIKDRQLGTADRIEASLGIDMVVAWRIYHLTMLGRETPDAPCTTYFKDVEWKALHCYANKTKHLPKGPPKLAEAIRLLGRIGGHMGRKKDGPPGTQTLWRGIQRLETATEMYIILADKDPPHPRQSGP